MNTLCTEKSIEKSTFRFCIDEIVNWYSRKLSATQYLSLFFVCLSLSYANLASATCQRELDESVQAFIKSGRRGMSTEEIRRFLEYNSKHVNEIYRSEYETEKIRLEFYKNRPPNSTNDEASFRQAIFVVCRFQSSSAPSAANSNGMNAPINQPLSQPPNQINNPQQNQSTQQQAQQAQQQAQQAQDAARVAQTRADQARQGQRRRHEPENEAHDCLSLDVNRPGFGVFVNKCDFKVSYSFCNFNPKKDSWADAHNCLGRSGNSDFVGPRSTSAAHIKNTETVYWFACKDPAWSLDTEYVPGQGLQGRCRTVGGK